jgi:hypothetical protein
MVIVRGVSVGKKFRVSLQAFYGRGRSAEWEKTVNIVMWIMARKVAH